MPEVIYICVSYGLISIVIWLNRKDLQKLNIDSNFIWIWIFIFVGCLYSLIFPVTFGVFLGSVAIINLWFLSSNKLQFEYISSNIRQSTIFILIILAPLLIKLLLGNSATSPDAKTIIEALFTANLPTVVFEEVTFRGLMWMFLAKLSLKEYQIILIQGVLFWISHLYYFKSDTFTFWFWLPFSSIMLGIIVWRSKKIASSIVGHYLYNFFLTIIR